MKKTMAMDTQSTQRKQARQRRGRAKTQAMIDELNERCEQHNVALFVCDGCTKLYMGQGHSCWQSKSGEESALFCDQCTVECDVCGRRYPPDDYRYHDRQYCCEDYRMIREREGNK
jgi:hypothetical protein